MKQSTKIQSALALVVVGLAALFYFSSNSPEPAAADEVATNSAEATSASASSAGETDPAVDSTPESATPTEVDPPAAAAQSPSATMDDDDIEALRRDGKAPAEEPADPEKRYSAEDLELPKMLGEKLGKPAPKAVYELLDMKKRDADADDLVEHVEQAFPKDGKIKALTIDWLKSRAKAAKPSTKGDSE